MRSLSRTPSVGDAKGAPGEQLQMFMTPNEIMSKYQAWDGDRDEAEEDGNYTNSPFNRDGILNAPRKNEHGQEYRNMPAALGDGKGNHWRTPLMETDAELYSRKVAESKLPTDEYHDVHRGGGPGARPDTALSDTDWQNAFERSDAPVYKTDHTDTYNYNEEQFGAQRVNSRMLAQQAYDEHPSLYASVASEGARSPVHLGDLVGKQGKPQVIGGHHRLGIQADVDPNQPMPVWHSSGGPADARKDPYTDYS